MEMETGIWRRGGWGGRERGSAGRLCKRLLHDGDETQKNRGSPC